MDIISKSKCKMFLFALIVVTLLSYGCKAADNATIPRVSVTLLNSLQVEADVGDLLALIEQMGEGELYSPSSAHVNDNTILFRSSYLVCKIDIETFEAKWTLDLRDLYGYQPDIVDGMITFYSTKLLSARTPDNHYICFWSADKPLYLIDIIENNLYSVISQFEYNAVLYDDYIEILDIHGKQSYYIRFDNFSITDAPPESIVDRKADKCFIPGELGISSNDEVLNGQYYYVYSKEYGKTQVFFRETESLLTMPCLEGAYSFKEIPEKKALIFECDGAFYIARGGNIIKASNAAISYKDVDYDTYRFVYQNNGSTVRPFEVILIFFDLDTSSMKSIHLDVKALLGS